MRLVTPEQLLESAEDVQKWATEMNPPDYTNIEYDDPHYSPALLRGYNLARHHVRKLLESSES